MAQKGNNCARTDNGVSPSCEKGWPLVAPFANGSKVWAFSVNLTAGPFRLVRHFARASRVRKLERGFSVPSKDLPWSRAAGQFTGRPLGSYTLYQRRILRLLRRCLDRMRVTKQMPGNQTDKSILYLDQNFLSSVHRGGRPNQAS